MHLLIITQYYPPETGALPSRWGDFSKILANQHCKVTILCESPHYPNKNYYRGFTVAFFICNSNLFFLRLFVDFSVNYYCYCSIINSDKKDDKSFWVNFL